MPSLPSSSTSATPSAITRPDRAEVLRAIDLFLAQAYGVDATPSKTVQAGLSDLRDRARDEGTFFTSPLFLQPTKDSPASSYTLRLGNRFYQHMKLVIQPTPDGTQMMYRADTHDRHLCPPSDHPEYAAFLELRRKNQTIAEAVENAWAAADICTFKTYLQNDLRRRREQQKQEQQQAAAKAGRQE